LQCRRRPNADQPASAEVDEGHKRLISRTPTDQA
jgi:hypothetical protein